MLISEYKHMILILKEFFKTEKFLIKIAVVFLIYLLGIISILRANFYYVDDLSRFINVYRGFSVGFGRSVAEEFFKILSINSKAWDFSPLSQIIAIGILSLSSMILVYVFNDKKLSFMALIGSIGLGLSPFFLENLSYKEESMSFALAIFLPIFPFLFLGSKRLFIFFSFICMILMLKTYQAASGIYILMLLFLAFKNYILGNKNYRILFYGFISYIAGGLVYKAFLMPDIPLSEYSSSEIFPFKDMFNGVVLNLEKYLSFIWTGLGDSLMKYLIIVSLTLFVINSLSLKGSKFKAFISSMAFLIIGLCISWGLYLVLQKPLLLPRTLMGFGFFISIVLIYNVSFSKFMFAPPPIKIWRKILINFNYFISVALVYNFVVFGNVYGNVLANQKEYENFRAKIALHDLSKFIEDRHKFKLELVNNVGFTPAIEVVSRHYPLIYSLVEIGLNGGWVYGYNTLWYYDIAQNYPILVKCPTGTSKVLLKTAYHDIKKIDDCYQIIFK